MVSFAGAWLRRHVEHAYRLPNAFCAMTASAKPAVQGTQRIIENHNVCFASMTRKTPREKNAMTRIATILAGLLTAAAITSPALAADPIKIGVVTPLSGTYTPIGQQVRWGLELAAKEVNSAGGIMGRQIELIFEDEEANPSVAVQKAEKLFEVQKVDFLTGTVNSGSTLAVGQTAERAGKLCE